MITIEHEYTNGNNHVFKISEIKTIIEKKTIKQYIPKNIKILDNGEIKDDIEYVLEDTLKETIKEHKIIKNIEYITAETIEEAENILNLKYNT